MKTVRDVLLSGQSFLAKADFPAAQARRELEDLLAHLLACKRLDVYLKFEQPLSDNELETMRGWLKRRSQHEPLQWIIGHVEYLNSKFPVHEGLFIPRPETEEWVEWVSKLPTDLFPNAEPPKRFLEIGVGSGIICCSLLKFWSAATAVGIDLSETAITATQAISKTLAVSNRLILQAVRAGKFSLKPTEEKFDFIVSNPPYIPLRDKITLAPEVLRDPSEALLAGEDGLDAYRTFVKKLPEWGTTGTGFAFEIGINQAEPVSKLFESISSDIHVRNDFANISRLVWGHLR